MSPAIGAIPVRYFSDEQLDTMQSFELINIVEENDWLEIIGSNKNRNDWRSLDKTVLLNIVKTKMNEYKQEVQKKGTRYE